jgi:phenylacetate-CoA ligase
MHGLALIYILRDQPGVKEFKVVQESTALTRVLLVTESPFNAGSIDKIVAGFRQRLGNDVNVEVQLVDRIPAEKSGKFRYIVSHAFPKA